LRVLWALEELQLPFELIGMDHPAHELNTDNYNGTFRFECAQASETSPARHLAAAYRASVGPGHAQSMA
jgi:hypothetical protein